jgi:hypothetical protein
VTRAEREAEGRLSGATDAARATAPIRNPAVIRRPQEGGWSVLVNLDNVRSVALSPTADLVWRTLDGRRDAAAVVAVVRRTFSDVPASVTDDVTGLLDELAESGFVGYECC